MSLRQATLTTRADHSGRVPARYERLVTNSCARAKSRRSHPDPRTVRSTDYGDQARLVTDIRLNEGRTWDWKNQIVYLPELDSNRLEHVMSVEGLLVEVKLEAPSVLQPALSRQRFVPVIGRLSRMVNHAPVRFGPSNDD